MTIEECDFILSPNTRKMASFGKSNEEYRVLVDNAIEELLNIASRELPHNPVRILNKTSMGKCPACENIVTGVDNYCGRCGLRLEWTR